MIHMSLQDNTTRRCPARLTRCAHYTEVKR